MILLDTHVLLWAAATPARLPAALREELTDPARRVLFSVASLWEVTIKRALARPDFDVDPRALREGLRANGFEELPILAPHALAVADLPALHRDPFDRVLIAQATAEDATLVTADAAVAAYPGPIRAIRPA